MRCPKCQFDHELQTTECLKCGIVFSRYEAAMEASKNPVLAAAPLPAETVSHLVSPSAAVTSGEQDYARRELKYRALALPLALIGARLLTGTGFRVAAGMLAMVLHESGHAISAWLVGRWAVPMLWVTMHGEARSWSVVLGLAAAIIGFGYLAWRAERWGWVCIAGALLLVQLIFLNLPAEATIVFGGDGGAMVLGTLLMIAFYAPRDSKLYRSWGLRWGLLVIGALAFMFVFRLWSGRYEDIPFGEVEGVNLSDPSLLTEMYGWSVSQLIDRYLRLATFCFAALAVAYVWGLVSAYLETRSAGEVPEAITANSR